MRKATRALSEVLGEFIKERITEALAEVLLAASRKGRISFEEVRRIAGEEAEEVLLVAYQWRLLVPERTSKESMEWEDGILGTRPEESYKMPNVISLLVEEAGRSGCWEPDKAVAEIFRRMGEPEWACIPKLLELLRARAVNNKISAEEIKEACRELGLAERTDPLIAELKASGIISPVMTSLFEAILRRSPVYELNPSLIKSSSKPSRR